MRSALLIAAIASLVACGSAGAEPRAPDKARGANLDIVSEAPLVVRGSGFRPGERLKLLVTLGGRAAPVGAARASRAGRFTARLRVEISASDALVIQALGARGSRAMTDIAVPITGIHVSPAE